MRKGMTMMRDQSIAMATILNLSPADQARLVTVFQSAVNGSRHLLQTSAQLLCERPETIDSETYQVWLLSDQAIDALQGLMSLLAGSQDEPVAYG